jgi:hypothetical protein
MITLPRYDLHAVPHLVSVGVVGAVIIGTFFCVGFLLLARPHPVRPYADPFPPAQTMEELEISPPEENDTAWGPLSVPASEKAEDPRPVASTNREVNALTWTTIETAPISRTMIPHPKRVGVDRLRHKETARHRPALWRPDAGAGPNPGGGFYGPPNVNVGYINPK